MSQEGHAEGSIFLKEVAAENCPIYIETREDDQEKKGRNKQR